MCMPVLKNGKIFTINDIDNISTHEMYEELGTEIILLLRYNYISILIKLENNFGIVSLAESEKIPLSDFDSTTR